jgi:hypothetical protein
MLILILVFLTILLTISWLWARGIDNMMKDFPDYSGEDLLDENPKNLKK